MDNVLLTPYDISRITNILSPEDTVERIYINFCNPWDHPKQFKKRLTHPRQLEQYATFFLPERFGLKPTTKCSLTTAFVTLKIPATR